MARVKKIISQDEHPDDLRRFEKMRKEKRSVRGRTVDDWFVEDTITSTLRKGIVIEVQKRNLFVAEENEKGLPETENLWFCSVAKRHFQRAYKERNFVVVGDRVLFEPDLKLEYDEEGQPLGTDLPRAVIQHSYKRKNQISRKDPMHHEWDHVMLANIDLIAIVASILNPEVRWGLIDRFLVQAEFEGIAPIIILNKWDLLEQATPHFQEEYKKRVNTYRKIGYEVFEICALTPKKTLEEVQKLRALFKGKIIGFAGHSGVGKSSVLNLMRPEFKQIVDENPDIFYKGRHTTTYNSLIHLRIGAYAIDTPGIRSFAIEPRTPAVLSHCFPEFRPYRCKFPECAHDLEVQCAIKTALTEGFISPERYRSYLGILKGQSTREGEGDAANAELIADFKAREQKKEQDL